MPHNKNKPIPLNESNRNYIKKIGTQYNIENDYRLKTINQYLQKSWREKYGTALSFEYKGGFLPEEFVQSMFNIPELQVKTNRFLCREWERLYGEPASFEFTGGMLPEKFKRDLWQPSSQDKMNTIEMFALIIQIYNEIQNSIITEKPPKINYEESNTKYDSKMSSGVSPNQDTVVSFPAPLPTNPASKKMRFRRELPSALIDEQKVSENSAEQSKDEKLMEDFFPKGYQPSLEEKIDFKKIKFLEIEINKSSTSDERKKNLKFRKNEILFQFIDKFTLYNSPRNLVPINDKPEFDETCTNLPFNFLISDKCFDLKRKKIKDVNTYVDEYFVEKLPSTLPDDLKEAFKKIPKYLSFEAKKKFVAASQVVPLEFEYNADSASVIFVTSSGKYIFCKPFLEHVLDAERLKDDPDIKDITTKILSTTLIHEMHHSGQYLKLRDTKTFFDEGFYSLIKPYNAEEKLSHYNNNIVQWNKLVLILDKINTLDISLPENTKNLILLYDVLVKRNLYIVEFLLYDLGKNQDIALGRTDKKCCESYRNIKDQYITHPDDLEKAFFAKECMKNIYSQFKAYASSNLLKNQKSANLLTDSDLIINSYFSINHYDGGKMSQMLELYPNLNQYLNKAKGSSEYHTLLEVLSFLEAVFGDKGVFLSFGAMDDAENTLGFFEHHYQNIEASKVIYDIAKDFRLNSDTKYREIVFVSNATFLKAFKDVVGYDFSENLIDKGIFLSLKSDVIFIAEDYVKSILSCYGDQRRSVCKEGESEKIKNEVLAIFSDSYMNYENKLFALSEIENEAPIKINVQYDAEIKEEEFEIKNENLKAITDKVMNGIEGLIRKVKNNLLTLEEAHLLSNLSGGKIDVIEERHWLVFNSYNFAQFQSQAITFLSQELQQYKHNSSLYRNIKAPNCAKFFLSNPEISRTEEISKVITRRREGRINDAEFQKKLSNRLKLDRLINPNLPQDKKIKLFQAFEKNENMDKMKYFLQTADDIRQMFNSEPKFLGPAFEASIDSNNKANKNKVGEVLVKSELATGFINASTVLQKRELEMENYAWSAQEERIAVAEIYEVYNRLYFLFPQNVTDDKRKEILNNLDKSQFVSLQEAMLQGKKIIFYNDRIFPAEVPSDRFKYCQDKFTTMAQKKWAMEEEDVPKCIAANNTVPAWNGKKVVHIKHSIPQPEEVNKNGLRCNKIARDGKIITGYEEVLIDFNNLKNDEVIRLANCFSDSVGVYFNQKVRLTLEYEGQAIHVSQQVR